MAKEVKTKEPTYFSRYSPGEMKHLYLKDINKKSSRVQIYHDGGVRIRTFRRFKGEEYVADEIAIQPWEVQEVINSLKEWDPGLYDKFHGR